MWPVIRGFHAHAAREQATLQAQCENGSALEFAVECWTPPALRNRITSLRPTWRHCGRKLRFSASENPHEEVGNDRV